MRELRGFVTGLIKRMRNIVVPVKRYTFKDINSSELFSFLYIGWDRRLCFYWLSRFSNDFEKIRSENKIIASGSISEFLKKNNKKIDLAIVESTKESLYGKYPNSFLLPRWMEMELNIESSLKTTSIKKIIKEIKKYSLTYEIREGIEALDLFYHTMYKPHILKRHSKSADLADYNYFYNKILTEKCELFFLIWENKPVAGSFIELKKSEYRMTASGIKDGSDEIFKMRATGAIRYFIMRYYYEKGIQTMLVGSCMPVVFDGVSEYKLHMGAKPYLKDLNGRSKYLFMPMNTRPSTEKVLKSNPLFYLSSGTLNIALFLSASDFDNKEVFFRFFNRIKTKNVEMTRLFSFDNSEKIKQWIHEEDITNVEFINYERVVN